MPAPPVLSILVAQVMSLFSPNVICAMVGFSAVALLHSELDTRCREQRLLDQSRRGERSSDVLADPHTDVTDEKACGFRIVGCLNRRKGADESPDVWKASTPSSPVESEAKALEPDVRNLTTAVERLRFKIDTLTLRRQAATPTLMPPAPRIGPPPPPPRAPSSSSTERNPPSSQ
ncbi:hypothetical protein EXIGLDRAFT_844544 [Exidia glandulosa HHB12029]|uniref:Uncharacterized protein n=1 Tax=Exidia glandulosa HHB12029 TaxID=1314781 RepID=A0A165BZ16_EXIGL|nr:hypothetical protein EXIGLDRAFT_844544 [Exidia glandulosa HHB12029]